MKKGFTLVELLVVIVIIGMLSLIAYPSIINIVKDSREEAYKIQKKVIEKAAREWAIEHPTELSDIKENGNKCDCQKKSLSISKLGDDGYLSDSDIKNPKGGSFEGCVEIKCDCKENASCNTCKYVYEYKDVCLQN